MKSGFVSVNMIILGAVILMIGYWVVATPKMDILKTVQDLPKLTVQKLVTPNSNPDQDSQVAKKPIVDQNEAAKLTTQSIKSSSDLDKISKDTDNTNIDNLDKSINQIDTDIQ